MRNKRYAALAGAGVLGLFIAVFALGTPGQTPQPAPSKVPAPQAQPAAPESVPSVAALAAKAAAAEAVEAAAAQAVDEAAQADSEAEVQAQKAMQAAKLSAKLAGINANEDQVVELSELQATLADLDSNLDAMKPALQEAEKKVIEMNNDDSPMVFEDGDDTGWLGIEISEISVDRARELKLAADRGVEVLGVESDSPAGKAGMKEHDVIVTFDGQTVEGRTQFRRLVRETPPGRAVNLGISRDGAVQTLSVVIGERKNSFQRKVKIFTSPDRVEVPASAFAMPDFDFHFIAPEAMDMHTPLLGISAEDLSGQLGAYFGAPDGQGVLVREVRHGTPADKAGLKAGDVITKVDETPVKSLHELRAHLREKGDQKSVNMSVLRKGSTISVPVEIDKPRPIDPPQVTHRAQF